MTSIQALETKDVTVDGNLYVITAMSATDGMEFFSQVQNMMATGQIPARQMKEVIIKYVKLGSKKFDEKSYDIHFSRKYDQLNELFAAVMEFNFGEIDPNGGEDDSDE